MIRCEAMAGGRSAGLIAVHVAKAAAGAGADEAAEEVVGVAAAEVVRVRLVRKARRAVLPATADRCDVRAYGFV